MKPLISICIPVYNRQKTVIGAIESALAQTYTNIEIVAVDNASTDSTYQTLQEYASKDSRVRCYRNDSNIGPVNNWKRCVELSRGEYIKILYSDDRLTTDSVEILSAPLEDKEIGFTHGIAEFDIPGKNYPPAYRCHAPGVASSIEFLLQHAKDPEALVSPSVAMFRREDLVGVFSNFIPSPDEAYCNQRACGHDSLLFFRVCMLRTKFYSINKACVILSSSEEEPSISSLAVSRGELERKRQCYRYSLSYFLEKSEKLRESDRKLIRVIAALRDFHPRYFLKPIQYRNLARVWQLKFTDFTLLIVNSRVREFVKKRLVECLYSL